MHSSAINADPEKQPPEIASERPTDKPEAVPEPARDSQDSEADSSGYYWAYKNPRIRIGMVEFYKERIGVMGQPYSVFKNRLSDPPEEEPYFIVATGADGKVHQEFKCIDLDGRKYFIERVDYVYEARRMVLWKGRCEYSGGGRLAYRIWYERSGSYWCMRGACPHGESDGMRRPNFNIFPPGEEREYLAFGGKMTE